MHAASTEHTSLPRGRCICLNPGLIVQLAEGLCSPDAHFCESGTYRDVTLTLLQTINANNANISYLNG